MKNIVKLIKKAGFIHLPLNDVISADYIFKCPDTGLFYISYKTGYVRYIRNCSKQYHWHNKNYTNMSQLNPKDENKKYIMLDENERLLKILSIAINKQNAKIKKLKSEMKIIGSITKS